MLRKLSSDESCETGSWVQVYIRAGSWKRARVSVDVALVVASWLSRRRTHGSTLRRVQGCLWWWRGTYPHYPLLRCLSGVNPCTDEFEGPSRWWTQPQLEASTGWNICDRWPCRARPKQDHETSSSQLRLIYTMTSGHSHQASRTWCSSTKARRWVSSVTLESAEICMINNYTFLIGSLGT